MAPYSISLRAKMKFKYLITIVVITLISNIGMFTYILWDEKKSEKVLQGFDVSHYQGTIRWDQIKANVKAFAIAKASGGTDFIDPDFQANWNGMKEQELVRGAYHFFYPNEDAALQAKHYLKTIGNLSDTDLPPIIDIEVTNGLSSEAIIKGVLTWLEAVESGTKRKPIIYSDLAFVQTYLSDERFKTYPLWVADYSDSVTALPEPWSSTGWSLWQYSDKGSVVGIEGEVDLDEYQGSLKEFNNFIKRTIL